MCSICLEDFKDGDRLRILHCSHGQRVTCGLYFDSNDDTKGTICYSTDTQTHPFNGHLSGTARLSRYQNGKTVKPIRILLKQETVSGSGISLAICMSALRSRQPRQHSTTVFTGRMPFLPPSQQRQSRLLMANVCSPILIVLLLYRCTLCYRVQLHCMLFHIDNVICIM